MTEGTTPTRQRDKAKGIKERVKALKTDAEEEMSRAVVRLQEQADEVKWSASVAARRWVLKEADLDDLATLRRFVAQWDDCTDARPRRTSTLVHLRGLGPIDPWSVRGWTFLATADRLAAELERDAGVRI